MASYNTVITNEGAALLASVIANQGTLTFSEMRFSTTDYDGVEQTLTVGTFGGVFITAAAAGSVVDATTIKVAAQFDNSGIVGDHPLYSIGIVGTDGNTTALIAVCTTTNPDIIRAALTGVSTYAFNVNLAVSSTLNITVTGTTAAALYDTDVVDTLTSTATDKPLSANMGRVLNENIEAIVDVYGAKQMFQYPFHETTKTQNDIIFTDNEDGTVTVSGTATNDAQFVIKNQINLPVGNYAINGCPSGGSSTTYRIRVGKGVYNSYVCNDTGNGNVFSVTDASEIYTFTISISSGTAIITPITFKPMLYDARITDPTFVPFAETNLQLTRKTSGLSNRNLLDNPWFTVNQRGAASYATIYEYSADRWKILTNDTTVAVSSNGITLSRSSVGTASLRQILENTFVHGKTVTASVLLQNGTVLSGTGVFPTTSGTTIDLNLSTDVGIRLGISGSNETYYQLQSLTGNAINVRAVKLEVGSVSTLHLDVAPDPTTELLKCQRYFYRTPVVDAYAMLAMGMVTAVDSTSTIYFLFTLPVAMRAKPQMSYAPQFGVTCGSSQVLVNSLTMDKTQDNRIFSLIVDANGVFTVGAPALLWNRGNNTYLDFDSEL